MSEKCHLCHKSYDYIYWVPNHVWDLIKPTQILDGGLLCLDCAHARAKLKGIVLRFSGHDDGWLEDDLTAAKAEIERLRGRYQELLAEKNFIGRKGLRALCLRKQAEAVDAALGMAHKERDIEYQLDAISNHAESLRLKADELDND